MKKSTVSQVLVLCAASTFASLAGANTVTVDVGATGAIYNADNAGAYSVGNPVGFMLAANTASFTLLVNSGSVSFNGGGNTNDADGVKAAVTSSSNSGTTTLSGITAPNAGYLVGVFLGAAPGSKPSATSYSDTTFSSYSPLIQQVFFIGDGLTGDGTGNSQTFFVPTGATSFYLGFSDAPGYNGAPGAYDDNSGSFNVSVAFATAAVNPGNGVPEPEELALLGLGAVAAALIRRKR